MAEIIAASHDVMFKALFVSNKDILRAFLRDVLDLPLTEKDRVDILNPELIPESSDGKLSRLDIHVEMADRRFNIEMQARKNGFSAERVLYITGQGRLMIRSNREVNMRNWSRRFL